LEWQFHEQVSLVHGSGLKAVGRDEYASVTPCGWTSSLTSLLRLGYSGCLW